MRAVYVDPSERVISCVKVYGRWGRFNRVACRTCWVQLLHVGSKRARFSACEGSCEDIFAPVERMFGDAMRMRLRSRLSG